jgi:hypothetical protein
MSLIHWWPLNGDLKDVVGGNDLALYKKTSDTVIVKNNNGKIGACYERTAIAKTDTLRSKTTIRALSQQSICAWIYLTEHAALNTANGLVTNHSHSTQSGLGLGMFTTDGNNCYLSISAGTGSSRIHSDANYRGKTNIKGGWHHVCVTYDTDQKIRIYVDGKNDHPNANGDENYGREYNLHCVADYLDVFNWSTAHVGSADYRPKCKISDVRIYDHALSLAEIKELSKALVVHYTFNDILAEPTTNVSTVDGWNSYTSYFVISERTKTGLKVYRPTNSTNTTLALNNSAVTGKMAAGEVWTFSCYLYVDGKPYKCTQPDMSTYKYSGISYYSSDDGYYTCTFTVGAPETWIIHAPMFGSVGTNVMCEIDKIQFEKKGYATPYTSATRDSMLQNEAGYTAPKSVTALQLSTTTNSGSYSGYFDGQTSCIDTPVIKPNMFTEDYTLSLWVHPLDNGRAVYFGDHQLSSVPTINFERKAGGALRYYHNGSPDKTFTNSEAPEGEWTMLTVTYTPGTIKAYKNGVLVETFSHTASITKNIDGVMRVGRDKRTGSDSGATPFYGYISDFRFYATCLSDDDIQNLYEAKAYVTDKGDMETYQLIEKTENIINEADFAIPAKPTTGNGKIEMRNGVMAYGLQANTYYYAGDAESSNAIFKGKFKANTQYYFDLYMDVDTMWYAGGSKYVPGGFVVRYTDGTTVEVNTTSTNGANGWKRVQFYSNPAKTIYGLGVYYYIGTKWYLRHDSGIYEVDKDNAQVTSKYTIESTQVTETSYQTNALIHQSGNIVGREIIEI